MIKVAIVRGSHLNNFEGQNFSFINNVQITGISSLYPIHNKFSFPIIKLPSLADLQKFSWLNRPIKFIANRVIGDSQILFGLEQLASQFDIFHSADPHYYYSYQLARLKKLNKIKKLIITSWETIPFNNEGTKAKKSIKYFVLNYADLFLCHTNRAKETLIKEGRDESKIKVIRIGVDLDRFIPLRRKSHRSTTILFAGRLVEEKGILDLLEAFVYLKKQGYKDLKLEIVGRGVLEREIKRKIKIYGVSDMIKMTSKSYKSISLVYQNADVFVLPSKRTSTWEEQYGMVLIEAMASGLPVIASKTGAVAEILGDCGLYFSEGDRDDLITQLITLIRSFNLRTKLGKMGRRRVEKYFDAQKSAKKFEEIYYQLIKDNE